VFLQRALDKAVAAVDPLLLLLEGVHMGGKKALEAQGSPLLLGEGRALVEEGKPQQKETGNVGLQVALASLVPLDIVIATNRHSPILPLPRP